MYLTVSGDYSATLTNSVGCDSIANINLTINITGLISYDGTNKKVIKIIDVLGKNSNSSDNKTLFYIYDDGTVERRIFFK